MTQDETTEAAPVIQSGSGTSDACAELRRPDSECELVVELSEDEIGLDGSEEPNLPDPAERLPGEDKTVNKP